MNKFTHRTKGGSYELVIDATDHGSIKSAGILRKLGYDIVLYRNLDTHQVYAREKLDFDTNMVELNETV